MATKKTTKNTTKNVTAALPGVILIMLLAGVITYGGKLAVAEATKPKPAVVKTVTVSATKDSADTTNAGDVSGANSSGSTTASSGAASSTTSPAAAAPPAAEPAKPTATTNSFVYLRSGAAASGTPLADLEAGTKVTYEVKSTGLWQKVTVNGVTGYVYKKWLTY